MFTGQMNDKNILSLLDWNIQWGFRVLVKEYGKPVYWHIRRITVNAEDAQDATQETFIRVFRSLGQYDRSLSFKAWLYRIATNEALRIVEKRHPGVDVDGNAEAMSMLADEYVDLSDTAAVNLQKAIFSLPRKQRMTFCLRYYDSLSFSEIAEITDTTADGAKANWHNAKVKVTNYLKEYV